VKPITLIVGSIVALGLCSAFLSGQVGAQTVSPGQLKVKPIAMLPTYKTLFVNGMTYRYNVQTGATARFFFDAGANAYIWNNVKEVDPPSAGTYEVVEGPGNSLIRINIHSEQTWLMVSKFQVPEFQKLIK
jgi:hypothetical protein